MTGWDKINIVFLKILLLATVLARVFTHGELLIQLLKFFEVYLSVAVEIKFLQRFLYIACDAFLVQEFS